MPRNRRKDKTPSPGQPEPKIDSDTVKAAESILTLTSDSSAAVEIYPKLHDVMEKLIKKQKRLSITANMHQGPGNRARAVEKLNSWISELNIKCTKATVADFGPTQGFGLKALSSIEKYEDIMRIPRSAILTSGDAFDSEIADFLHNDPVCESMPPIALSIFILHEKFKGDDSQWHYYLDSLPATYSGLLYFTREEFHCLKGSPTQEKLALDFRRLTRQYAIYVLQMTRAKEAKCLAFCNQFTWEDFRWALATVMSRNNPIPSKHVGCDMGLIPFWDMGNHQFGEMTTDYDIQEDCLIFHAMKDFDKDSQIVFHYGNRSNTDFLLYCGFTVENNPYDRFYIKLGISASDAHRVKRDALLEKHGLDYQELFYLTANEESVPEPFVAFARIHAMGEEMLKKVEEIYPAGDIVSKPLKSVANVETPDLEHETDKSARSFLSNRFFILLRVLTVEREIPATQHGRYIENLLKGEAEILRKHIAFLKDD